ncbi:MAG TPA: biotin/lipoyl-containing protein [Candidatus Acidoferrales bacterium]|nr:biotin/lipoyl-containing protein [Candidatus Acidoferrales bacterium]
MKCEIELGGQSRSVELTHTDERACWTIDGRTLDANAVEVSPGIYSILIAGKSIEARVEAKSDSELRVAGAQHEFSVTIRDPRQWKRNRAAGAEVEGRQQITAPMPGKIVLVLVKTGDTVEVGQGIVVVEAMKMQNEIRSPKSGMVERLLVMAGQTVNTGEVVAVIS